MTTFSRPGDDDDLDRWIADHSEVYPISVDELLNVDAGLRDVFVAERHGDLISDIDEIIAVDAGLAAIMSVPSYPELPAHSESSALDVVQELDILPLETRLELQSICAQAVSRARIAMQGLRDEFGALLRRRRSRDEEFFGLPSHSEQWFGKGTEDGTLAPVLQRIMVCLDEQVFDTMGDLVDLIERDCKEILPAVSWMKRIRDVYWRSGRDMFRRMDHLGELLCGERRMRGRYGIDSRRRNDVLHECLYLHSHFTIFTRDLEYLEYCLNNFTDVDLRGIDLGGFPLAGIRWSLRTMWPSGWRDRIRGVSFVVSVGVFEIERPPQVQHDMPAMGMRH